jgi:hypothetical protein
VAITVLYCAECSPPKVIGAGACVGAFHTHPDGSKHAATVIADVDEPDGPEPAPDGSPVPDYPFLAADGTSIATPAAWLTYLERYLP